MDLDQALARTPSYGSISSTVSSDRAGVKKVEVINKYWTKQSLWIAYGSIFLLAFITSLESQTTYTFTRIATSSFSAHSLISSVGVISNILLAVIKPPMAKLSDVFGRTEAFAVSLILYVIGDAQMAGSGSVGTYASAQLFFTAGGTGIQILQQIIIADTSSLLNRALLSSIPDFPYLVTVWMGPPIAQAFLDHSSWRWGYGVWCVIVPAVAAPLILSLWYNQRKAKKDGILEAREWRGWKHLASDLDLVGVLLLVTGLTLVLLPLTLAGGTNSSWNSHSIITMLAVGGICLALFIPWEIYVAKHPCVPFYMMRDRTVLASTFSGFFFFMAYYVFNEYFTSYLQVARYASPAASTRISEVFSFASTVSSITTGLLIKYTKRYKVWGWVSIPIYLLGLGLMVHFRGPESSTALVVMTQVLTGVGGGSYAVAAQLAVQANVKRGEVGIATALYLTLTSVGGAVGAAISGAIWTQRLPDYLRQELPLASLDDLPRIYNDFVYAAALPRGSEARDGTIRAYTRVMRDLTVASTVCAVPMLVLTIHAFITLTLHAPNATTFSVIEGKSNEWVRRTGTACT
ncbi:MFS general substrate transporter [Saitoella complicata NRRL Y-17804]|uniref:MFS general substrate transporter n=1 Tax=Saitoella complicata (strain BCRC 22490 / CBS 7301 / JCM 7358 / NBRC 10748 / NRRL Y-17804) TaxID=698492 RepID=UPI0008680CBE|nr:MFS general substrate transporter [Saitoella complicata NRRL Y-17804]ODQ55505.1 MFS general substrate transporter [Saitoella complicata NRRL Y-17804]